MDNSTVIVSYAARKVFRLVFIQLPTTGHLKYKQMYGK